MDINLAGSISYYVNPNNRTLTTNIKNTAVSDDSVYEFMQKKLRPVDDLEKILKSPIKLAGTTSVNRAANSINLAEGAQVTVADGFVLTVKSAGVEVSGGNVDNDRARQEAMDMGGALATLLRNACGMMKNTGTSSEENARWNANVPKVLSYFGIDASRDFTVNGMRYTRDSNGRLISQANIDAASEYEKMKSANRTFEFADEKTKKAIAHMSNYYLKNAPSEVSDAWHETLEETGINPFPEGYTSVLQHLSMEQDFMTGGNDDLFGGTVESNIAAVEKILERIDNPIGKTDDDYAEYLNNERIFFSTLLVKIQQPTDTKTSGSQIIDMIVNDRMKPDDSKSSPVPSHNRGMTVTTDTGLTLHYEKERPDGSTCKFSWVDAKTGVNTCVYKPADFSEENPILHVEIWDKDGNLTEKDVNPLEVNPSNASGGEMAAYSVYLKETGQCQNTDISFLWAKSNLNLKGGAYDGVSRMNWERLAKEWLDMQFGAGNLKGYYDFNPYYDLLRQQCDLF